jgi:hypothetical protein
MKMSSAATLRVRKWLSTSSKRDEHGEDARPEPEKELRRQLELHIRVHCRNRPKTPQLQPAGVLLSSLICTLHSTSLKLMFATAPHRKKSFYKKFPPVSALCSKYTFGPQRFYACCSLYSSRPPVHRKMAFGPQHALVAVSVHPCCNCKVAMARLTACDKRIMNVYCRGLFCGECVQCLKGSYGVRLNRVESRCFCLWAQCQCLACNKKDVKCLPFPYKIDAVKVKWHHTVPEFGSEAIDKVKRHKRSSQQENDQ